MDKALRESSEISEAESSSNQTTEQTTNLYNTPDSRLTYQMQNRIPLLHNVNPESLHSTYQSCHTTPFTNDSIHETAAKVIFIYSNKIYKNNDKNCPLEH